MSGLAMPLRKKMSAVWANTRRYPCSCRRIENKTQISGAATAQKWDVLLHLEGKETWFRVS